LLARTADEGLQAARSAGFIDVVVIDVVLGKDDDRGGLRLLGELRKAGVHAPVIVITAYADVEKVKIALNEGAAYLLEKPFRAAELSSVIRRVQTPGGGVQHNIEQVLSRASLTDKEREVAKYILEGLSSTEIAERAHNSPKTIRQHVSRIYEKCGVGSRAEFFRLVYPH
jgi:DNA-binding NarL/FixJ family response regulator